MIFKTFDSDIDKISSKWGMFGRSFNDIGTAIVGRITDINKAFQATDDLIGSIKDSDNIWKRLYPSKESIKSQLIDVDSLIPKIDKDNFDFDKWINKLNDIDKQVKSGTLSWQDYSNRLDDNQKWIAKWGQETEGQIRTEEDLVKANKQARNTIIAQNEAIKAQTLSAKAGKVALQALATVGNMIAMWAISKGIELAVKGIDNLVHSAEKCKERVDELMSSYQSALDKANSNAKTIEDLASKYETLSKGVNRLGENVSLTTDEYSEYNKIVNQIADMFPSLIQGYTNEGNAILSLKGNVEQLRDAYKEAQQEAYNMLIVSGKDSDGNDIIKNYQNQVNGNESFLSKTSSYFDGEGGAKDAIEIITRLTSALTPDEFRQTYNQLYKEYENIWHSDKIKSALKSSGFEELSHAPKWSKITVEDLANVKQSAQVTIQTYQAEIDSALKNVQILANAYLMTNEDYADLDDNAKTAASLMVNSINAELANGFEDKIDVGVYVANIVSIIKDNPSVSNALNGLFTTDFSSLSYDNAKTLIDRYIRTIVELTGRDPIELKATLGFSEYDDNENLVNNVKEKLQDKFDDNVGELSLDELQIVADLEVSEKDLLSWNELIAKINEVKNASFVNKKSILPFTETISQVQSLSIGLEKLRKIYTDVKNQEDFDWSSILNNEEFAKTFSGMGSAYDNFIKAVSTAPNDIEACQKAFDQLATSYIYNTKDANGNNIMDNLTRSTKDATVAMLEQMGVVNALELVEAELSKKEEALEVQRIYASEHTIELTEASLSQAKAYITEADCSEIARKYLAQLYLQKNLSNKTVVSTAADCQNLIELAKTAGYSQSILLKLETLKQKFAKGERILSREGLVDINNSIKNIFSEAEADIGGIDFEVKFDSGDIGDSAAKTAQSFTDLLDKELTVLDQKMEAGYIDFKDYIRDRLALIEDYYSQGKIKADEYYSYLENHYKQELSYRDKVVKAVTRRIDKEIDSLEKQKDAVKENYQLQIDALENQKTLLEDANKERQRQIDLQKALYELERAKNQRTKLVYSEGGGMHYVADDTAIRDAEKEAENAKHEIQISEIEKSITLLEKSRDAETDAIDDMIDKLQEYKEKWNDITSAYEESQEDLLAAQFWGQDWEKDILDARLDKLNQFKDGYIKIQQAMVDAAHKAAQAMETGDNVTIDDSSKVKYEVVYEGTAKTVDKFSSLSKAQQIAKEMSEGIPADEPSYYVRQKYHTGLKQGLVDKHSFDDDFRLVQKAGLGEKEVPAILKEGEAVATPAQISNIADELRTADSIPPVQAVRPYFMEEQERLERCAASLGRSVDEILFPPGMALYALWHYCCSHRAAERYPKSSAKNVCFLQRRFGRGIKQ